MHLLGYGEDSWTYVALKNHLNEIIVLYRPSFGRKKGLGEFDFIIMSATRVYFGESKMALGKKKSHLIKLKNCQVNRHHVMQKITKLWFLLPIEEQALSNLSMNQLGFQLPSIGSTLYTNLNSFISLLSSKYTKCPELVNVLLLISDIPINGKVAPTIADFSIINMITSELGESILPNYINML